MIKFLSQFLVYSLIGLIAALLLSGLTVLVYLVTFYWFIGFNQYLFPVSFCAYLGIIELYVIYFSATKRD